MTSPSNSISLTDPLNRNYGSMGDHAPLSSDRNDDPSASLLAIEPSGQQEADHNAEQRVILHPEQTHFFRRITEAAAHVLIRVPLRAVISSADQTLSRLNERIYNPPAAPSEESSVDYGLIPTAPSDLSSSRYEGPIGSILSWGERVVARPLDPFADRGVAGRTYDWLYPDRVESQAPNTREFPHRSYAAEAQLFPGLPDSASATQDEDERDIQSAESALLRSVHERLGRLGASNLRRHRNRQPLFERPGVRIELDSDGEESPDGSRPISPNWDFANPFHAVAPPRLRLAVPLNPQVPPHLRVLRYIRDNPKKLLVVGGVAGVTYAALKWSGRLDAVTVTCAAYLTPLSQRFVECLEPFEGDILKYKATAVAISFISGVLLEQGFDTDILTPLLEKHGISLKLLLAYIYRGASIDEHDAHTFNISFKLHLAATILAAGLLGITGQRKWDACIAKCRDAFLNGHQPIENINPRLYATLFFSAAAVVAAFNYPDSSPTTDQILTELVSMAAAIPIAMKLVHCIRKKARDPSIGITQAKLWTITEHFIEEFGPFSLYPLYLVYGEGFRTSAATVLGAVIGNQQAFYQAPIYRRPRAYRAYHAGMLSFTDLLKELIPASDARRHIGVTSSIVISWLFWDKLSCYNNNPYNCPVVLGIEGEYVNIDGSGIKVSSMIAVTHFYARRLFRMLGNLTTSKCLQNTFASYVKITDSLQFHVWTMVPYAMFNSGEHLEEYLGFVSHNPMAMLALMGIGLGTSVDRINATEEHEDHEPAELAQMFGAGV